LRVTLGRHGGDEFLLDVIVEGVESSEQERELLRLGAGVAPGCHLGVPAPTAEIEARWGSRDAPVAGSGGAGRGFRRGAGHGAAAYPGCRSKPVVAGSA